MLQYEYTNDVERVARVLTDAFLPEKFENYLSEGNVDRDEHFKDHSEVVERYLSNGGYVVQAGDFSAIAILAGPENFINAYRDDSVGRVKKVKQLFDDAAEKYLGNKKFWHLSYLARDPNTNVKGAVSAVVRPFMEEAKRQNVPFMVEAVGEKPMQVYQHWGFKTMEILRLGEGEVDSENRPDPNGEGIAIYYMIYNYESVNNGIELPTQKL